LVAIFKVGSYHFHKYWNEGEVHDLVKDVIGSG